MARELGNDHTTPSPPRGEGQDERGEKFLNIEAIAKLSFRQNVILSAAKNLVFSMG